MQADSGLMFANQTPEGEPRRIGLLMADIATALYAAQAGFDAAPRCISRRARAAASMCS